MAAELASVIHKVGMVRYIVAGSSTAYFVILIVSS